MLIAHAFTTLLAALVAAGWITYPSKPVLDVIATATAVILALVGAFVARSKVTPSGAALPSSWAEWEQVIAEIATEIAQQQIDTYVAVSERDKP